MDLHAQAGITQLPELTTARLSLRPMALADASVLAATINDYEISKWLTMVPYPYGLEDAEWFINENRAGQFQTWAIYNADVLIGGMGLNGELGYWLAPNAWGQGFATEAGRAVLAHGFADPEVTETCSSHFVENRGSKRVLEKLGFEDIGGHVHYSVARKADVPGRSMRLTRARWDALQHG